MHPPLDAVAFERVLAKVRSVGALATLRLSCAAALALTLVSATRVEGASPRSLELDWSAPSDCPNEDALRAAIERLLGYSLEPDAASHVYAHAFVFRPETGPLELHLAITEPGGRPNERRIASQSCAELADAAALIIALAIDPEAGTADAPEALAPAPSTPPPIPSIEAERSQVEPPLPPERSTPPLGWFALGASLSADFATLPAPTPGLVLSAARRFDANRLELMVAYWFSQRATLPATSTVGGEVELMAAAARYCRSFIAGPPDLAACAGLEAGLLQVEGFGIKNPVVGRGPWLAPRLDLRAAIPIVPPLDLTGELTLLAPLVRDRYTIAYMGEVYQAPPLSGRAQLGLEFHFW